MTTPSYGQADRSLGAFIQNEVTREVRHMHEGISIQEAEEVPRGVQGALDEAGRHLAASAKEAGKSNGKGLHIHLSSAVVLIARVMKKAGYPEADAMHKIAKSLSGRSAMSEGLDEASGKGVSQLVQHPDIEKAESFWTKLARKGISDDQLESLYWDIDYLESVADALKKVWKNADGHGARRRGMGYGVE